MFRWLERPTSNDRFLCSEDVGRSGQRNVSHNTIQAYTILCYISPEERVAVEVSSEMLSGVVRLNTY